MIQVNNNLWRESCLFCKASAIYKAGTIHYDQPVLFSSTEIKLLNVAELWRCKNCFSGFTQNAIPDDDMVKLYTHSLSSRRWVNTLFEETRRPEVVKAMELIFGLGGLVVDVGCNTGELLDFAKGLGCKTIGVELSTESKAVLFQKVHEVRASLEDIPDQSVDVITAFDLVEHLHDVVGFLSLCRRKLKAGGKLVLLTGNIGSLSLRLTGSAWWYCRYPEHIAFPSSYFLSRLSGLGLLEAIPTYSSVGYYTNWLRSILGWLMRAPLGKYRGLPSLGPDHCFYILQK